VLNHALGILIAEVLSGGCLNGQQAPKVDFRRDVQPIFSAHCYQCHGPDMQMNGFRLDRRRDAMRGGTIAVIGPSNAEGSRLYQRLIGSQYGLQMPPSASLESDQIQTVKMWIDQGAEWPDDLSGDAPATQASPRATRLMRLLRSGDIRLFRQALARDPGAAQLRGPNGSTPLMYAALYGDVPAMQLLLARGADPNARNDAGATALMWAVNDLKKTRLLVRHGADVNERSSDGRTPVLIASGIHDNSSVVQLLLENGAQVSVEAPVIAGIRTPLTEAASIGDAESFQILLQQGADLKRAGALGLYYSLRAKCPPCTQAFLRNPAPDLLTQTMFLLSPPRGTALGLKPLLHKGANARAVNAQGNSILALAAISDAQPVETIQSLIDRGADVNGRDARGESVLSLARRNGRNPVVNILLRAGVLDDRATEERAVLGQPADNPRAAVERSLPLLQKSDALFLNKAGCVSCHNNSLTAVTVAVARKHGYRVNEQEVRDHLRTIGSYLDNWRESVLQNHGIPGDADSIGYILYGLAALNYPADETTDAMAQFLKLQQSPGGDWRRVAHRPPLESSDIEVTALAMRSLQTYAPPAKRAEFAKAVLSAATWLRRAEPKSTEDAVFRILGLVWSGADKEAIRTAAGRLIQEQRPDGGWAQTQLLESDAYATGQALVALHEAAAFPAASTIRSRAVQFLLARQMEDGSWHVKRRAAPLQPYFESGFPYGPDQFISVAATNWAATALMLVCGPATICERPHARATDDTQSSRKWLQ
jgi:ankyrin repeat protein